MLRYVLLLLILLVGSSSGPAFAGENDPYAKVRAASGFATWPNKGGALKKGLIFKLSDYPALNGFVIANDLFETWPSLGMLRDLHLKQADKALRIFIGVAHTSTDNAHEMLLRGGLSMTQADFAVAFMRGDTNGIAIGDLNYVSRGASATNIGGSITFVRNNVFVSIRDAGNTASEFDIKQLATDIDTKIKSQPDLTPAQFDAKKPAITTFAPANNTLLAKEGSSTTLNAVVNDPSGEAVKKIFDSKGKLQLDTSVTPVTARSTHVTGTITIELTAVNDSLQFSTAQTTITVNAP